MCVCVTRFCHFVREICEEDTLIYTHMCVSDCSEVFCLCYYHDHLTVAEIRIGRGAACYPNADLIKNYTNSYYIGTY